MHIAIVDDNKDDRRELVHELVPLLKQYSYTGNVFIEYDDGRALCDSFEPGKYDIIFLDIYMPSSGIQAAEFIREKDKDVFLVFVTTSNSHASESYDLGVNYYLLKPVSKESLKKLTRLFDKQNDRKYVTMPSGTRILLSDLIYTEYYNHRIRFHLKSGTDPYEWISNADAEALLCEDARFFSTSRGIIVNLEEIDHITDLNIVTKNNMLVPVSRRRLKAVKEAYADYIFNKLRGKL